MNSELIDEESVDTEALQAQIDLSMSFAQNLVSSWMEPHKFPTSSRRKNLEQELTDYMKRPPRLGVGAAIPEGMQSQTQETARLRGKLAGSKRSREEEDVGPSKTVSDDEGESRAVAIKKKARSDPFDVVHGKKKKRNKDSETATTKPTIPATPLKESTIDSSDEIERILNGPNSMDVSPPKSKKKRSKSIHKEGKAETTDTLPALVQKRAATPPPSKVHISMEISSTSPRSPKKGTATLQEPVEASSTKTKTALRKTLPSELLKVPLLNLTGPPSDPELDCEPTTPSTSPKRKRKRRKKRKSLSATDVLENINSAEQPTPT